MVAFVKKTKQVFISVFLVLLSLISIAESSYAAPILPEMRYAFDFVWIDFEIQRTGTVEARISANITTTDEVRRIRMEIPYASGQNISFGEFKRAEITESGEILNPIGVRSATPLVEDSPLEAYYVQDTGNSIVLNINASIPSGQRRRLDLNYTLYQAAQRHVDAGVVEMNIWEENRHADIRALAISYQIEARAYEGEESRFSLLQRNSSTDREHLLQNINRKEFLAHLEDAHMELDSEKTSFFYFAESVPHYGYEVKALMPPVWLSRLGYSSEGPQLDQLMEEQREYEINKIRRYELGDIFRSITSFILILASLIYLFLFAAAHTKRYRQSKHALAPDREGTSYSALTFLESLSLNGRVLSVAIYELVEKSYLSMSNNEIHRVSERIMPNEDKLYPFERLILHWVWDLMDGKDSIAIERIDDMSNRDSVYELSALRRIKNLYELHLVRRKWIPMPGERKLQASAVYVALGLILCSLLFFLISSLLFPLLLLIPAVITLAYGYRKTRYTAQGEKKLWHLKSYRQYLKEIDQQKLTKESLIDSLEEYMVATTAFDISKEFLSNLRYVLEISDVLRTSLLRKYGLERLQRTSEDYLKMREVSRSRANLLFYGYILQEEEKMIRRFHTLLIKLYYRSYRDWKDE